MTTAEPLSQSLEDYLEAIFHLIQENRVARVKDVAARLSVQMPSVTGALRSLAAKDLVNHDPYSYITLTPQGEEIARDLVRRHEVLTHFLTEFLGLRPEAAENNACQMEHAIEPLVLDRLVEFIEFAERCPRASVKWIHGLAAFCGACERGCVECVESCLEELRSRDAAADEGKDRR